MTTHQFINKKTNNTMHSISATAIKLFIKSCANLICIGLLFITQTAQADFRKTSNKQACNRKGYHRGIYLLKLVIHARNSHGYWVVACPLLFDLNVQK
jgi:hypothetical protein